MEERGVLKQGKFLLYAGVATLGWILLSVLTIIYTSFFYSLLWIGENVINGILTFYGKETISVLPFLCRFCRFLLISGLNIARIRPNEDLDIEGAEHPLVVFPLVLRDMAKPNRVTFTIGVLLLALLLANSLSSFFNGL
ncbi:hypothetical protein HW132_33745 [Brasilonema sp. CT11]|nr:hypothetical protein [Brasilonema sp. CT11]